MAWLDLRQSDEGTTVAKIANQSSAASYQSPDQTTAKLAAISAMPMGDYVPIKPSNF